MGLFGQGYAARAASEIIGVIDAKIAEHSDNPEITAVLGELREKATEIEKAADSGWY